MARYGKNDRRFEQNLPVCPRAVMIGRSTLIARWRMQSQRLPIRIPIQRPCCMAAPEVPSCSPGLSDALIRFRLSNR